MKLGGVLAATRHSHLGETGNHNMLQFLIIAYLCELVLKDPQITGPTQQTQPIIV